MPEPTTLRQILWLCVDCGSPLVVPADRDQLLRFVGFRCCVPSCSAYNQTATTAQIQVRGFALAHVGVASMIRCYCCGLEKLETRPTCRACLAQIEDRAPVTIQRGTSPEAREYWERLENVASEGKEGALLAMAAERDRWREHYEAAAAQIQPAHVGVAEARPASSGWQPIETAPKDESRMILFNPDESMGSWAVQAGAYYEVLGGWQYDGQLPRYSNAHQPSHWMPLPAPPDGAQ